MAFQFPASPVLNQVFTPITGVSYKWNGTGWLPYSSTYVTHAEFDAEKGAANGVATLDSGGKVPVAQLPDQSGTYVPIASKGAPLGVPNLDASSLIVISQIPSLAAYYVALGQKGAANGVATLDTGGKVPASQLPASASGVPAGVILDFAGTSAPTGYLLCDGSNVNRTTYALLFAAIGTTWGTGDGSTTFTLPDMRRRAAIGSGGTATYGPANTAGSTGGTDSQTLAIANLALHSHGGTTNQDNTDHVHAGTTNIEDVAHSHAVTLGGQNVNHSHQIWSNALNTYWIIDTSRVGSYDFVSGSQYREAPPMGTAGFSVDHVHAASVGSESSNHQHGYTSGGRSSYHYHDYTTDTRGSGTAFSLFQPSAVVTKIIRTGL